MDGILYDLRSGFRILTKSPGPAAVAVVVLALGIGATGALFSMVDGTVLKALPYPEPQELMHVEVESLKSGFTFGVCPHDFVDYRAAQTSFEDLSGYDHSGVSLSDEDGAVRIQAAWVSASAFPQLRVEPLRGRLLLPSDEELGAEEVIVLGYHVWRDRFGLDPGIVGSSILVDSRPTTVVGVMAEGFRFPVREDAWLPLRLDLTEHERGSGYFLEVFGRLREGTTLEQARSELTLVAQRLEQSYPDTNEGIVPVVKPFTEEYISSERRNIGLTALGAVFFLLLIACSNVANLLLARTADRTRELAVKTALGAGRERLIGQVLGESLCLALLATPFGLVLAYGIVKLFNASIAEEDWPFWFHVAIDTKAVAVIVALTAVSALLAGLMPALRASRIDVQEVLKDEGRGGGLRIGRLARALVVAEVALSCVLLVGAGLMVRSIVKLQDIDFAFETEGIFSARLGLTEESYPEETDRRRFFERLQSEIAALPGVESTALSVGVPGSGSPAYYYGVGEKSYASDEDYPWAFAGSVTPGFFETLGVSVVGRGFNTHDVAESEAVTIVNRSFAEREWPGENPIGRRVRLGRSDSERPWMTVVGVVPDLHMGGIENRVRAGVYRPLAQSPPYYVAVLARTGGGDSMALAEGVRGVVRELDRGIALFDVESLAGKIDDEKFFYRMIASIFSGLGLGAVLLAAVGMYGVLAFSVSKRTTEIGIRVALGATARDVRRLVVGQGMRQVVLGLVLGLVLAAAVANLMSSQLFGIRALDPVTFAGIAVLLLAVGVLAALVPAERARRIDPIVALRYE